MRFGTIHRPLSKKSKLSISLDQKSEFIQFVFIVCPSRVLPKFIETKVYLFISVVSTYVYKTRTCRRLTTLSSSPKTKFTCM